ncbi:MAG TPA: LptF/LptG family permease [Desulfohalobiaceae bacterium]|nr:LptF/LptG family permease [Desulfohalobiaceae bacterium]
MRILDQYITLSLIKGIVLIIFILACLFSGLEFSEQLEDVGTNNYQIQQAIYYVVLTLPGKMMELAPISSLLGSILTLGLMSKHREFLALQASGLPMGYVCRSVILTSIFLTMILLFFSQWIIPPLEQQGQKIRTTSLSVTSAQGFWARSGREFLNIRKISPGGVIKEIYIYSFGPKENLRSLIYAEQAILEGVKEWILIEAIKKNYGPEKTSIHRYDRLKWQSFLSINQQHLLIMKPGNLALSSLFRTIEDRKERGGNIRHYSLALWQKLTRPFMVPALIMLILPMFLFQIHLGHSLGLGVVLASIGGGIFFFFNKVLAYLILLFELKAPLILMSPVAILLTLSIWQLRRKFISLRAITEYDDP